MVGGGAVVVLVGGAVVVGLAVVVVVDRRAVVVVRSVLSDDSVVSLVSGSVKDPTTPSSRSTAPTGAAMRAHSGHDPNLAHGPRLVAEPSDDIPAARPQGCVGPPASPPVCGTGPVPGGGGTQPGASAVAGGGDPWSAGDGGYQRPSPACCHSGGGCPIRQRPSDASQRPASPSSMSSRLARRRHAVSSAPFGDAGCVTRREQHPARPGGVGDVTDQVPPRGGEG